MADKINSRNNIPKYQYFFVVSNNKRTLSRISFPEFKIYKFENPVAEARGRTQLTNEYVTSVVALTDDQYIKEYFIHPNYRNQKNEHIKFLYTEIPVVDVKVADSRKIGLENEYSIDYSTLIKRGNK